jgi:hypothetical protein
MPAFLVFKNKEGRILAAFFIFYYDVDQRLTMSATTLIVAISRTRATAK